MTRHGPTVLVADEFGPVISTGGTVTGYDELAPEEIAELRADPRFVHLYDANRIVSLLLARLESADSLDPDVLERLFETQEVDCDPEAPSRLLHSTCDHYEQALHFARDYARIAAALREARP